MGTPGDKITINELNNIAEESQSEKPNEMTVADHLQPQFPILYNYYVDSKAQKSIASTPEPVLTKDEPNYDEPGPSGLQTPKKGTKVNTKRLKKIQGTKKQFACPICQKTFQNSNKLSKHQQIHGTSSPFKCEHCKKSFTSKFKLVRHVLIHSDRKPFSCSICERTFHRKDHLKNHIKIHSPCKKVHVCEKSDCKKEYTSSLSYKKHLALHAAEEGKLDCQICQKSFKTKDEVLYHLKIHAGSRTVKNPDEKKFSCDYCQRKFFTRKDVRRHLVVHTGKRDFLCQFCPQRFGRKDHLVRHIKKSHMRLNAEETLVKEEDSLLPKEEEEHEEPQTSEQIVIKTEEESNPETTTFPTNLDLESLFPLLEQSSTPSFLPQDQDTSTQGELTDLGSEILDEITDPDTSGPIFDDTFIDLLEQEPRENLPLPAFSQTFHNPPK